MFLWLEWKFFKSPPKRLDLLLRKVTSISRWYGPEWSVATIPIGLERVEDSTVSLASISANRFFKDDSQFSGFVQDILYEHPVSRSWSTFCAFCLDPREDSLIQGFPQDAWTAFSTNDKHEWVTTKDHRLPFRFSSSMLDMEMCMQWLRPRMLFLPEETQEDLKERPWERGELWRNYKELL